MTTDNEFNAMIDEDPRPFIPWEAVAPHLGLTGQQTFAQYLSDFRREEGWTQTETAKRLGMSKQLLADYEKGRKLPSIEQTLKIGTALNMAIPLALGLLLDDQIHRAGLTQYRIKLERAAS